jgi:L-arabinose isomerase
MDLTLHTPPLRIGLFGIGLDAYWPQFAGLRERLEGYLSVVDRKLRDAAAAAAAAGSAAAGGGGGGGGSGGGGAVEVVNLGLIDTPQRAMAAGHAFRAADVDLIVLHVTTYALSSTVLPVVRRAKVPVVLLNLQPTAAIDYAAFNAMGDRTRMTGEWLAHCGACPVPEVANVFRRAGVAFHQVTGLLEGDAHVDRQLAGWVAAARVAHAMAHNRLGVMGHYYGGMLDIYTDLTRQLAGFGGHVEVLEVDELAARRARVGDAAVRDRVALFHEAFDVQPDCPPAELARAARTSVALDQLVADRELGSLAYYYMGSGNPANEDAISSIILGTSLLTGRGVPVAGELEIKNAQAMKVLDGFGAGGSFTEYYAMDYAADVVLMGHDGPGHVGIAQGKTKVRPLGVYHGKVGRGLSVEMSVRHGPVTLLSVVEDHGHGGGGHGGGGNGGGGGAGLKLLVAEGESVAGPTLQIGNTNSRYRFAGGARAFVEAWNAQGPAHHCAVGVGHLADRIGQLGLLLDMPVVRVG